MSEHGATLQTYNQELVKCLEDLKVKRREISAIISREENEKSALDAKIQSLTKTRNDLNANLHKHRQIFENYDRTIQDTEEGFKKILESSHTLLNLAQHEASKLKNNVCKNMLEQE